jgi:metal-responsive CopG/Arc/MetJ family transcriptional regulator
MVKVILSTSIDGDTYKKLDEFSKKKKIPKSKVIEEALNEYFERHG